MKLLNLFTVFMFSFSMRASDNTIVHERKIAEENVSSFPLPTPDLEIFQKLDSEAIRDIIKQKEDINKKKTGFSPGPTSQRILCLETPLKKLTKASAALTKVPPCKKRKLNKEEILFTQISSKDTAFNAGYWSFSDPMAPLSFVGINCSDQMFDSLIEDLLKNNSVNCDSQKFFIASIIQYINDNSNTLRNHLFCAPEGEMWCRHFATLALPIFTKLLNHKSIPYSGEIHQLGGELFDGLWQRSGVGHVWNILKLKDNESDTYVYWFVDVFNKNFIDLSSEKFLKNLMLYRIDGRKIIKNKINNKDEEYLYARASREKFNINMGKRKNLYNDEEKKILSMKKMICSRNAIPQSITKISLKKK